MIKLGITGNIASGKSLIESFLKEEGIKTLNSDKIVHDFLDSDKETIQQVCELFKPVNILDENGKISRKIVGKIVFKDKSRLKELEKILHPKIKAKINEFFNENKKEKLVAIEVPLLYEANMQDLFDYIIFVAVDDKIQIERLIQRNKYTQKEAQMRINAQIPQAEKINKANFVIYNNSNIQSAKTQLNEILGKLKNLL